MAHARGFVTQYKYRDHLFEDSLLPCKAEGLLTANAGKEAIMRRDGSVVVRDKHTQAVSALPVVEQSRVAAQISSSEIKSTAQVTTAPNQSMRKVSSAYLVKTSSAQASRTTFQRPPPSQHQTHSSTMKTPWCPGHARSRLFDTDPYSSVIHPAKFEGTPFQRFQARLLHKENHPDFNRHISKLNRPFLLTNNACFEEKPPRIFYNHAKAEHDFFASSNGNEKLKRAGGFDKDRRAITAQATKPQNLGSLSVQANFPAEMKNSAKTFIASKRAISNRPQGSTPQVSLLS